MKKSYFKHLFILIVSIFIIAGCGGGNSGGEFVGGENDINNNSIEQTSYSKSFSYDNFGRLVKENLGNGAYIEYIYDDSGNLISQKVVK